ncbi:T9SS type A sorting domain-containing protein [Tamlana sp. 2201CG12-4]|uniref:T9SS type A sorting domain-containing protein n=1 Tax=Tamlana sp. 2201CG12-4 TaxID=3112582 RepID=UPI002DBD4B4E|nr:T9SS type A sorting domain-containing protein [Tamlana sp. 2201CG12-4]MEC3906628.1 T9SS type A sorting domain-containing protein [Tamlana sp. 2201CG12-4]
MKKNYFFLLLIIAILFTAQDTIAQNNNDTNHSIEQNIEGLSIYPNPVNSGKTYIYITSKSKATKKVEFYNVLGKRIFVTNLIGRELNIANFNKGVYLLKITENNISETRKLVIK